MTLTVRTKIVEETVIVKKEVRTYNLEMTEDQLIDIYALLSNCGTDGRYSGASLFWVIDEELDEVKTGMEPHESEKLAAKLTAKTSEFAKCFSGVPRAS